MQVNGFRRAALEVLSPKSKYVLAVFVTARSGLVTGGAEDKFVGFVCRAGRTECLRRPSCSRIPTQQIHPAVEGNIEGRLREEGEHGQGFSA